MSTTDAQMFDMREFNLRVMRKAEWIESVMQQMRMQVLSICVVVVAARLCVQQTKMTWKRTITKTKTKQKLPGTNGQSETKRPQCNGTINLRIMYVDCARTSASIHVQNNYLIASMPTASIFFLLLLNVSSNVFFFLLKFYCHVFDRR